MKLITLAFLFLVSASLASDIANPNIEPALIPQAVSAGVNINDPAQVAAWVAKYDAKMNAAKPPQMFSSGVKCQGPLIIPGETNGAFEVWVDSETGLVLSVLDHASPKKTKAEKDAAKKAKQDQIKAVKAATNDRDRLAALLLLLGLK
jgi:hypothetical protein